MAFHAIGWNMVGISEFLYVFVPFGSVWIYLDRPIWLHSLKQESAYMVA